MDTIVFTLSRYCAAPHAQGTPQIAQPATGASGPHGNPPALPEGRRRRTAGAFLCLLAGLLTAGLLFGGLAGTGHANLGQAAVNCDNGA